jgi:ergothioneine biosynthesis protein EgtB
MPDASPAKWHLAHTSWFFETFVLQPRLAGYMPFHPQFAVLFNSYYEAVGPRHPRPERGMLSRPSVGEVYAYRKAVDTALLECLASAELTPELRYILELGLSHEQQHQELLLTDLQHMLSKNPLAPVYTPLSGQRDSSSQPTAAGFERFPGGLAQIGYGGSDFAFDNERPRHRVVTEPYEISRRLVTAGEYLEFMRDGGYSRAELWLSDGWRFVQDERIDCPLYWEAHGDGYQRFSLHGMLPVDPAEPVCHVSFYEADAFARWAGARLPTEAEWELAYAARPIAGQFAEPAQTKLLPVHTGSPFGSAWVWTASPYVAYPGFQPEPGALGEYNGKFMCNQLVLRGGSCFTPAGHIRPTYRNFFPATARWQVTGIRLAR